MTEPTPTTPELEMRLRMLQAQNARLAAAAGRVAERRRANWDEQCAVSDELASRKELGAVVEARG